MTQEYIVIGTSSCPHCVNAKELLETKNITYAYYDFRQMNSSEVASLERIAGCEFRTVPQIFNYNNDGTLNYIGGFTDLHQSL